MSDGGPPTKKAKATGQMTERELAKGLISLGAALINNKVDLLAQLQNGVGGSLMAVHRMKLGNTGRAVFLAPKEWVDKYGVECSYDESGRLKGVKKDDVELSDAYLGAVKLSSVAYKKEDASMVILEGNEVIGCVPRAEEMEVKLKKKVSSEEKEVVAWRVTFLKESKTYYANRDDLLAFLEMECVGLEDMVMVAQALEDAVVKGGYVRIYAKDFATEHLAKIAGDTSVYSAKRNLASTLLGLAAKRLSMKEKIQAFTSVPSVPLAHAANFLQIQSARLVNITTQSEVSKVKLVSLKEDEKVLMNKARISQDYWNKFTDISEVEVYKAAGNLAVKKGGQKGKVTTAGVFEVWKAGDVLAIHKRICESNSEAKAKTPSTKTVGETTEIPAALFGN